MSTTPPIQYSGPKIDPSVPWEIGRHIQLLYQKLANHTQAFSLQQQAIAKLKPGSTTTNIVQEGGSGGGGGGGGGGSSFLGQGFINDQSGETGYATTPGDNGILLILNDPSPIAVSLTTDSAPFYLIITNFGAGTATLTPSTGTINGGASLDLLQNQTVLVSCDSTNWDSTAVPSPDPQSIAQVASNWLDSYDASTGLFTQSQPTAADVVNAASVIAANTFSLGQTLTNGFTIGTVSTGGAMQFGGGALLTGSTTGGNSVITSLAATAARSGLGIQAGAPEVFFNLTTVQSAINYAGQTLVETNPANFLDAANTIEYQIGVKKGAGSPVTVLALGDVAATIVKPAIFDSTVTQPDASVLTAATTATSATAGGASALPATPSGYLQVSINGTLFKVPYYAV